MRRGRKKKGITHVRTKAVAGQINSAINEEHCGGKPVAVRPSIRGMASNTFGAVHHECWNVSNVDAAKGIDVLQWVQHPPKHGLGPPVKKVAIVVRSHLINKYIYIYIYILYSRVYKAKKRKK